MPRSQNIKIGGVVILLLVLIIGIYLNHQQKKEQEQQAYSFPQPEAVVRQYFEAWNDKNYVEMYATLSDGFKKIDPNAGDLAAFRQFASSQGIGGVKIISIKEKSNDGTTAAVEYGVEFILDDASNLDGGKNNGNKQAVKDTFTLKYRQGDVIQGWKLIHPYGENIDTS